MKLRAHRVLRDGTALIQAGAWLWPDPNRRGRARPSNRRREQLARREGQLQLNPECKLGLLPSAGDEA